MSRCVSLIVGTRPEAIKLAPVAAALAARRLSPTVVFTGQHARLNRADYELGSYRAIELNCPGQEDPYAHVGMVSRAAASVVAKDAPDLVIVQGDTSSALGGALGGRLAGVPIAHVEAGLRSHDLRNPWPEEEFRIAIDREAELLFAPTELSAANLRRERARGAIHVTGNTGIDAVRKIGKGPRPCERKRRPRLLVTCHRRENWGSGLMAIAAALRQIAGGRIAEVEMIQHPNPFVSGQMRAMLIGQPGIAFRSPCTHSQTIEAMLGANLVLSDSGGIQEEATALGVPLLVLRRTTERPEAIASGNVELVGTDPARIVSAVGRQLSVATAAAPVASLPFGDGRASERIAAIIDEWLAARQAEPAPRSRVFQTT